MLCECGMPRVVTSQRQKWLSETEEGSCFVTTEFQFCEVKSSKQSCPIRILQTWLSSMVCILLQKKKPITKCKIHQKYSNNKKSIHITLEFKKLPEYFLEKEHWEFILKVQFQMGSFFFLGGREGQVWLCSPGSVRTCCADQVDLILVALLLPPECWYYRCAPPYSAQTYSFKPCRNRMAAV